MPKTKPPCVTGGLRTHLGDIEDELGTVLGPELQPGSEKVVVLGVREALRVRGREAVGDCLGFGQLEGIRRRLQRCVAGFQKAIAISMGVQRESRHL